MWRSWCGVESEGSEGSEERVLRINTGGRRKEQLRHEAGQGSAAATALSLLAPQYAYHAAT
jgi:hypothetical protein